MVSAGELPDAPPLKGFLDRWESMTLELGNQSCSSYYLSDMTALSFILNVQKSSKITNEVINNNVSNNIIIISVLNINIHFN